MSDYRDNIQIRRILDKAAEQEGPIVRLSTSDLVRVSRISEERRGVLAAWEPIFERMAQKAREQDGSERT